MGCCTKTKKKSAEANIKEMEEKIKLMEEVIRHHQKMHFDQVLKEIFNGYDLNGDGFVSAAELKESMKKLQNKDDEDKLTDEEINQWIEEADSDKDGKVSFEEFKKFMRGGEESESEETDDEESEKSDSEEISSEETDVTGSEETVASGSENSDDDKTEEDSEEESEEEESEEEKLNLRQREIKKIFKKYDKDGDGFITVEEFEKVYEKSFGKTAAKQAAFLNIGLTNIYEDGDKKIDFKEFQKLVKTW